MKTPTRLLFSTSLTLLLVACTVRDEAGNINPAQIRKSAEDTHATVDKLGEKVTQGAELAGKTFDKVQEHVSEDSKTLGEKADELVTEFNKPRPAPANVTQPY